MPDNEIDELVAARKRVYGDVLDTYPRIAQVWSGISGHEITAPTVALMMAGLKLVRAEACPDYSDNSDDVDGYINLFRTLVGEDMVKARTVDEYLRGVEQRDHPMLKVLAEASETVQRDAAAYVAVRDVSSAHEAQAQSVSQVTPAELAWQRHESTAVRTVHDGGVFVPTKFYDGTWRHPDGTVHHDGGCKWQQT